MIVRLRYSPGLVCPVSGQIATRSWDFRLQTPKPPPISASLPINHPTLTLARTIVARHSRNLSPCRKLFCCGCARGSANLPSKAIRHWMSYLHADKRDRRLQTGRGPLLCQICSGAFDLPHSCTSEETSLILAFLHATSSITFLCVVGVGEWGLLWSFQSGTRLGASLFLPPLPPRPQGEPLNSGPSEG